MSLFFVDNSCDLDTQQIKNLGIECFNLPTDFSGESLDDFDYPKFYSKLRKGIVISPKSLTEKEYISIFEPAFKMGDDIIYVHASSSIIDTTNLLSSKKKLSTKFPDRRFELIDSKNFSSGYGVVAFMLALKYHNGDSIDEIVEYSHSIIDSIAMYMIVDSLEPLSRSGKLYTNAVVGTALNIKSIIAVDYDGKFKLVEKVSGKKRAISKLIQIIRQTGKNIADNLTIVNSSSSTVDTEFLLISIKEHFGEDIRLLSNYISPINTSIVGSNVITLAFNVHKKTF